MIKLSPTDYFAVKVPDDAYDFKFQWSNLDEIFVLTYKMPWKWEKYKKENWQWESQFKQLPVLIGQPWKERDEETAAMIVQSHVLVYYGNHAYEIYYRDYLDVQQIVGRDYSLYVAIESLQSLLVSNNLPITDNYVFITNK